MCQSMSIKAEPSCSDVIVKDEAAELYTDHAVKDELVVGPEIVERRGVHHASTGQTRQKRPGSRPYRYRCDQCEYTTAKKTTLRRHVRTHSKPKLYKCGQCSYASAYETHLKIHMWNYHTAENLYKCDQCSYASGLKSLLRQHLKAHGKTYQCEQYNYVTSHTKLRSNHCDRQLRISTSSKSSLVHHVRKQEVRCYVNKRKAQQSQDVA